MDLRDILFDKDNRDPVTFVDKSGKTITFEQVAVIPYKEKIYCVLKPLDHIDGVADDEAIVFRVDEDEDGEAVIRVERRESIALTIFEHYYDLLEECDQKSEGQSAMGPGTDDKKGRSGILDVLFGKKNTADILLVNEKGQELAFKQIYAAVKEDAVYCILAPAEEVEGLAADGAFVFMLTSGQTFTVVQDEGLCECIFSEYYRSLKREDE